MFLLKHDKSVNSDNQISNFLLHVSILHMQLILLLIFISFELEHWKICTGKWFYMTFDRYLLIKSQNLGGWKHLVHAYIYWNINLEYQYMYLVHLCTRINLQYFKYSVNQIQYYIIQQILQNLQICEEFKSRFVISEILFIDSS